MKFIYTLTAFFFLTLNSSKGSILMNKENSNPSTEQASKPKSKSFNVSIKSVESAIGRKLKPAEKIFVVLNKKKISKKMETRQDNNWLNIPRWYWYIAGGVMLISTIFLLVWILRTPTVI